jgi:hypothetical protein
MSTDSAPEKLVCSADYPYQTVGKSRGADWEHPDAVLAEVDDYAIGCDGRICTYICPHCGLKFSRKGTQ